MSQFLSPVQECIEWEINREDEASDEDQEPEQSVLEGEEGSEHVVDAMDRCMIWVLLDSIQQDSFLHGDLLIFPAHLCKQTSLSC